MRTTRMPTSRLPGVCPPRSTSHNVQYTHWVANTPTTASVRARALKSLKKPSTSLTSSVKTK